jgi:predicted MFS family arabinose efflux permease
VLLVAFVVVELRVAHPLLPLRVPADRNRGASFLAILLSGAALFGVFLFLTYYLQQNRGYSPIQTGLAFLPMTGAILVIAPAVSTLLLRRVGPRVLVSVGMLLCAVGMAIFTRIGPHTSYVSPVLIGELVLGCGLALVFATAINASTMGVEPHDSGVASALVNACQQVGGALGIALLSTIAASATSSFATSHHGAAALASRATIHGYTVAFWVSAGLFALGAVSSALLFERDARIVAEEGAAPVMAH